MAARKARHSPRAWPPRWSPGQQLLDSVACHKTGGSLTLDPLCTFFAVKVFPDGCYVVWDFVLAGRPSQKPPDSDAS